MPVFLFRTVRPKCSLASFTVIFSPPYSRGSSSYASMAVSVPAFFAFPAILSPKIGASTAHVVFSRHPVFQHDFARLVAPAIALADILAVRTHIRIAIHQYSSPSSVLRTKQSFQAFRRFLAQFQQQSMSRLLFSLVQPSQLFSGAPQIMQKRAPSRCSLLWHFGQVIRHHPYQKRPSHSNWHRQRSQSL